MSMARFADAPDRIGALPVDPRGFPVPWFVSWHGDQPNFPVISAQKLGQAWTEELCWVCGQKLGSFRIWVIGPQCVLERACPEPPCHLECAEFAAKHCPFLASPLARRAPQHDDIQNFGRAKNASTLHTGVVALWVTKGRGAKPIKAGGGILFALEEPSRVNWYANGRPATREDVTGALAAAMPILLETAQAEGANAVAELRRRSDRTDRWLPEI